MTPPKKQPLPASWEECNKRGWKSYDVLLVTGDAYVDHPSFGVALIGRFLEHHGYKVAILAQPRYDIPDDFESFPAPRLFCGITAGNLDSIVANYTGNGKVRDIDAYSPHGSPWRSSDHNKNNRYRPDRASLFYANLARATFKDIPIVLGGVEASLRRFVHYDYKQEKLRASLLTDAKADLLVYGMAERTVLAISKSCENSTPLTDIEGSCERLTDRQMAERYPNFSKTETSKDILILPSHEEISQETSLFMKAELALDTHSRSGSKKIIVQRQQSHWVVQHPGSSPLSAEELDLLYELPYTRKPHPATPDIPAYTMIKDSITIVRGCSGNCAFCAITRHQGATIQSRSVKSIVAECKSLSMMDNFKGTISDLGGPTANLFGTSCAIGSCKKQDCLFPTLCKHLLIDEQRFIKLLDQVADIEGIRHVFISSGLRMELLLQTPTLFNKLIQKHIPGAMKIAPEHSSNEVLALMHKEPHDLLKRFIEHCRKLGKSIGKEIHLVPYVISAHPGCTEKHAQQLAEDMARLQLRISKFQDFTPTPGTISTAMYVTGLDNSGVKPIFVARNTQQRLRQRQIIEKRFIQEKKPTTKHNLKGKKKRSS